MTRKQHRRWKKQNLEKKKDEQLNFNDRPEWADYEKEEASREEWRQNFMSEMRMYWSSLKLANAS